MPEIQDYLYALLAYYETDEVIIGWQVINVDTKPFPESELKFRMQVQFIPGKLEEALDNFPC